MLLPGVLVALVLSVSSGATDIVGVVRDPHGLPVSGARVDLTCGRAPVDVTSTDPSGHFTIRVSSAADDCWVSVSQRGFAPARKKARFDNRPVEIQLTLARIDQTVTVVSAGRSSTGGLGRPLTAVTLGEDDLRSISNNTADLVRYATMLAGLSTSPAVYVDGLPSAVLPPAESVRQISVNADRFSAEYADGDQGVVELFTTAPRRNFRFNPSGSLLGLGGRDAIAPDLQSDSRSFGVDMGAGVPGLPVTLSTHLNVARHSREVPIEAVVPASLGSASSVDAARSDDRNGSGTLDAYYSRPRLNAHVSVFQSWSTGENVGVGGLSLPDAGFGSSSTNREVRATVGSSTARLVYQGGFAFNDRQSTMTANSEEMGVIVSGYFVAGGGGFVRSESTRGSWTMKHVLRTGSPKTLTVGMVATGETEHQLQQPNAAGTMTFATMEDYERAVAGESTATWIVARGNGLIRQRQLTLAAFAQRPIVHTNRFELNGGVRADHQSNIGTVISPRLSAAAERRGFDLRAGGGLFVQGVPNRVFARVLQNDGFHLAQVMAHGVPLSAPASPVFEAAAPIRSRFGRTLSTPRQVMGHASIGRAFGSFVPVLEYTWAREIYLLGSRRVADAGGWLDVIDSDRAATRHRVHAQARYMWKGQRFVAHYEWVHARDNTDGPFSHPERQDDLAREWARTAGIAPHNVTLMGRFRLPAEISLNVTDRWNSSSPYNITTGLDAGRNGLYNDRGGLSRNEGDGPGYHSVGLNVYKRVKLDRRGRTHVNLGVQIDNVFDTKNYMNVGSVITARTFAMPMAAFPGRSVRVRFTID